MAGAAADEKRWYMACLDLEGRRVLVVGGGPVALEKARELVACGATVSVVSPLVHPDLRALGVEWLPRRWERDDLAGCWLVVVATDDEAVQHAVAREAGRRAVFCNVVDEPAHCSVILPAVHRQGPITVAVSTSGASPALAKRLRDDIAAVVGPAHADLARQLRALRPWAKRHLPTYDDRREYFDRLVERALT